MYVVKKIDTITGGDFTDVPILAGAGGKNVAVKSDETGLEYIDPGGVTDHAGLTNLDYASAGHTGFAATTDLVFVAGAGDQSIQSANDGAIATGDNSFAFGDSAIAGEQSVAIGLQNDVSGTQTISIGTYNYVAGDGDTVLGHDMTVNSSNTFSIGDNHTLDCEYGGAIGSQSTVTGASALSIGLVNVVSNSIAMALGNYLNVSSQGMVAVGSYNANRTALDSNLDPAFVVGNGTDPDTGRSDAFAVLKNGRAYVSGDTLNIATTRTPASSSAAGTTGDICWDANFIYVCTATNTWKRIVITTW
jgi:hypothetical protein